MTRSDINSTGARIGRIANDIAKYALAERRHEPDDLIDALAGLAGELVAVRAISAQEFEAEVARVAAVLVAHARHRRQALGGPMVAGHA